MNDTKKTETAAATTERKGMQVKARVRAGVIVASIATRPIGRISLVRF